MIQNCEAIIRVSNIENPSTVRDCLKAYFYQHNDIMCQPIQTLDIFRDNNEVVITFNVDAECEFIPGCKGSYWEPGEPPMIADFLTKDDFLNAVDKALIAGGIFAYELELDEDSSIPEECDLLDEIMEDYC